MSKTTWAVDPTHSTIGFKVKHMMFTNVSGNFGKYEIKAITDGEDFLKSTIEFTADPSSVNTNDASRDGHINSADFFDTEHFPQITFKATGFKKVDDDGSYEMFGDLTIRGITKQVELSVEYGGLMKDPWGNVKAGFSIHGSVHRKDWGLVWNAALETGGVLVSDEVKINCEIQLVKQGELVVA